MSTCSFKATSKTEQTHTHISHILSPTDVSKNYSDSPRAKQKMCEKFINYSFKINLKKLKYSADINKFMCSKSRTTSASVTLDFHLHPRLLAALNESL